jgi:two-component system cell cycle sensor histidine kinase/response regulator CckA
MKIDEKTKHELIAELESSRRKLRKLETLLKERKPTEQNITEHKREAEEARRMVTVVRDSNDAITIQDFDGKITAWNRGAELMFGYSEQEALQMKIWQLAPNDKTAEQKDFNQRLFAGEKISSFETQRLTKDGRLLDVWLTATKLVDDAGKVIGIAATERDITERKKAEEKLLESERLLQKSQSIANLGSFVFDISKGFWSSSKILDDIFGIDENYIRSLEGWAALPHPDWSAIMTKYVAEEVIGKRQKFNKEYKITRKADGKERWVHGLGVLEFDKNNQPIKLIGTISDITERKLAEEALRKSEEKYRSIFENVQDVYYETLFDGTILEVSPSIEIISKGQYKRTDLIGKSMYEFYVDIKDRDTLIKAIQKTGSVSDFEVPLKNRDGSYIPCSISAKMSFDVKGQPDKIVGSMHDIAERKRAEVMLRESEDRYRTFFNTSRDCVFITSIDGNWIDMNDAAFELFGYSSREELMQVKISNLYSNAEDRAKHIRIIAERGYTKDYPVDLCKKNGVVIHTLITSAVRYDADGHVIGFMGTIRDITAPKRAEEELKKSEGKFRAIFDNASDGMFLVDLNARKFFICNAMCVKMLGYTQEEFLTLDIAGIHPPEDMPFINEQIGKYSRGEEGIRSDIRFKRKEGSIFAADLSPALLTINEKKYLLINFVDITERKRAEEALRVSVERYRMLFEGAAEGILVADIESKQFRYSNPAICKMLGYTAEEMSQLGIADIHPEEALEYVVAEFDAQARGQKILSPEIPCLRKDGNVIYASIATSPVIIDGRKCNVGFFTDITERKQAEEKLRETRDYLENLLSFANAPIMVWDNNYRITKFNIAFERLTGYTMYDVIGKHPEMLFFADSRETVLSLLTRTSDGEHLVSVEVPIRCKSGDVRVVLWNTANIYAADEKTIIATIAHGQDITKRKRAEEALQESELRFRSLYENATIGIYRTTPDGNILLANPALVKMLGYTSFHKLAERNLEKDGFESSSQRKEFLEKIEKDGEVHGYDSKWIRQDGTAIFVLESARAIRDSQGKTLYYDGTVEDITEHRQMEEGLRQMQKLEGLGTLAGGIAHDFNNILGIILAYITSAKRFKDDAKKLDLAVDTIVKAVERGKTLVQQILTFARKSETEFGAVDVNDVVMEIMTMLMETFPKILTYAQNFDKTIPYINADRSQLHQVLLNLCVNARDAMPTGGVLTINTRMVSGLSLRNQHPDAAASGYVCIEVSDTGEGMTPETRKRIFEPFFTTKGIGKGTGLGLAVVFGVVQTHKGFIDVESELGKGTTFRLYLPASQVAAPISVKDEEMLEEIPGGTETLLVVEDEEMLMMSLQLVLVEKGYKVISAGDGLAAVNIYKERKKEIALVLTDLGLPKMNGKEVCAQVKKLNPSARMIVATGYLDPEMKSEFLKAGVQHFLYKPYDLKKVLKEVREVLDGK